MRSSADSLHDACQRVPNANSPGKGACPGHAGACAVARLSLLCRRLTQGVSKRDRGSGFSAEVGCLAGAQWARRHLAIVATPEMAHPSRALNHQETNGHAPFSPPGATGAQPATAGTPPVDEQWKPAARSHPSRAHAVLDAMLERGSAALRPHARRSPRLGRPACSGAGSAA